MLSGLLIKNMRCCRLKHSTAFMTLIVIILVMSMVFSSAALSQASSSQTWESQTKNFQVEDFSKLSEWPQTISSEQGIYKLTFFPVPGKIPMRRLHSWRLHIENTIGMPVSGARIHIDGGMPTHSHGLPSIPKVKVLSGLGNYMIEGMKFSMGGEWQLKLAIVHQQADRAIIRFTLNP